MSERGTHMITRVFEVWTGVSDVTSEPESTVPVTFALPTPSLNHEDLWQCSQPHAR